MTEQKRVPYPLTCIDDAVRDRVLDLDDETVREWGGEFRQGTPSPSVVDIETDHSQKEVVRSPSDGVAAFERYTEFFNHVLSRPDSSNTQAVLVPCGKTKPIGTSSVHQKKVEALRQSGLLSESDLVIVSEPCTVIPHDMRLSLPAVNYDFPPKYAEKETAPEVFEIFTDRLATWIDQSSYTRIYPYLVSRHQNKFDAALEKASSSPEIVEIPGSSLNPETMSYSGDLFKTTEQIAEKIRAVRAATESEFDLDANDSVVEFYRDRLTWNQSPEKPPV